MSLVFLFRKLVFAQVLLGIIAFCMAEPRPNPGLLLVAGTLGALSWYVVEGPNGKPLPQWMIHLGAFLAVGWLVLDLNWHDGDVVLAMGHFTMWLQIIQLYGRKTNREYGLLLVLSLLQMVGAPILSVSMIFGILLTAYCVLALFTVLLFQLKATSDLVQQANEQAAPRRRRVPRPRAVVSRGHRWQFRLTAVGVGTVCAVIAVLLFVLVPRGQRSGRGFAAGRDDRAVGFADSIRLDGAPRVGNRVPVLNMTVTMPSGDESSPHRAWLLRGAALDTYDPGSMTWRRADRLATTDIEKPLPPQGLALHENHPAAEQTIDARITLRNLGFNVLFAPHPLIRIRSDSLSKLHYSEVDGRLSAAGGAGALVYSVQSPWDPATQSVAYPSQAAPTPSPTDPREAVTYAFGWPYGRGRLEQYTLAILENQGLARDTDAVYDRRDPQIARALADHLRDHYVYSLNNPRVAPAEDPTLAFILHRREGHCELFASALAAMCRSIGMRARVVTGFLASEYNHVGGYYIVRQDDAHAWTEIDLGVHGGWTTFDATPPAEVAAEHAVERGLLTPLRELYEHLEFSWISSIITYDRSNQDEVMGNLTRTVREAARENTTWLSRLTITAMAVAVVFIAIGIASLIHTLLVRRKRLATLQLNHLPRRERRALARRLRFYLHMLDLLERRGHVRPAWQSPFSFATQLAEDDPDKFSPVVALTEHFYEIRFGHRTLSDERRQSIRQHLKQLEQNLPVVDKKARKRRESASHKSRVAAA